MHTFRDFYLFYYIIGINKIYKDKPFCFSMKKRREIRKMGGSYFIKLFPSDLIDFEITLGDFVDIQSIKKVEELNGESARRTEVQKN